MLAAVGVVFGPFLFAVVWTLGFGLSPIIPVWLALMFGGVFFLLPDLEVRRDATEKRQDLRRVIGAYLDLVSMNLAGGRGLPEALMAAAEISDGWALLRIRNCLADARITGTSQWAGARPARRGTGRRGAAGPARHARRWSRTTARRSASRSPRAPRRCGTGNSPRSRARRASSPSRCSWRSCCSAAGFLVFLIFPAAMRVFQV